MLISPISPYFDKNDFLYKFVPVFISSLGLVSVLPGQLTREMEMVKRTGKTSFGIFNTISSKKHLIMSVLVEFFLLVAIPFYGTAFLLGVIIIGIESTGISLSFLVRLLIFFTVVLPIIISWILWRITKIRKKISGNNKKFEEIVKNLEKRNWTLLN
jgi:hypothetical protein